MKVFHIERDYTLTLEEQKKVLKSQYKEFQYLFADHATGNAKIHFIAADPIDADSNIELSK